MRADRVVGKVHQIDHHRNGISGAGFYAVLFDSKLDEGGHSLMVGIVFDEPSYCAVLRVDMLSNPKVGVTFGLNSWRGDAFEPELRAAVKLHEEKQTPATVA